MKHTDNQYIEIMDSTLRDGAQGREINFSVADKLAITKALDDLGVPFIEAGNPASSQIDTEFFKRAESLNLKNSKLVAFGATVKRGHSPADDCNLQKLLEANTEYVSIVGKASLFHVKQVLKIEPEENLQMIKDTLKYLREQGKQVFFDAEHFFDGYRENSDYAMEVLRAAFVSGVRCLVLCDTNGGSFPGDIYDIVRIVREEFNIPVGIHCHEDMGLGVASSHAAVSAGANHVQGTFLGMGERCGNPALTTLIANLQLKQHYKCIPKENLPKLTSTAKVIADITNITLQGNLPYVGRFAFSHKAGMHADGVKKEKTSFEHIRPEDIGNESSILLSELSGRSAIAQYVEQFQMDFDKNSPEIANLTQKVKDMVFQGYDFESATASFEMLFLKETKQINPFFKIEYYKVTGERGVIDIKNTSSAVVKVSLGDKTEISVAEGQGPVHAMDLALRKALVEFYPPLQNMEIADYKVRIVENTKGANATTRVLMVSTDGKDSWTTVGASQDIIAASIDALVDSFEYYLMKQNQRS